MDSFDVADAIGMLIMGGLLLAAVAALIRYWREPTETPAVPECVGNRAGRKACEDAYNAMLRAAALCEAAATYEGSPWRVGHFVRAIRATADELRQAIDGCSRQRIERAAAEPRLIIPAFNDLDPTRHHDGARVVQ
jgi:hypothetical protein